MEESAKEEFIDAYSDFQKECTLRTRVFGRRKRFLAGNKKFEDDKRSRLLAKCENNS